MDSQKLRRSPRFRRAEDKNHLSIINAKKTEICLDLTPHRESGERRLDVA